jgi:hypothetical protein
MPFAIQGYGPFDEQRIVPLGLHSGFETNVVFSLDSLENFPAVDIILEDRYLNIFHSLLESPYSVDLLTQEYLDRFFIRFEPNSALGINDLVSGSVRAFLNSDQQLIVLSTRDQKAAMELYDINGKVVWNSNERFIVSGQNIIVGLNSFTSGMYLLRISGESGSQSFKLNVY